MSKDDLKVLYVVLLFMIFAFVNTFFLWVPASAPPVMLVLFVGLYSIWEHKYGNKT
jgi:hypothetical protein